MLTFEMLTIEKALGAERSGTSMMSRTDGSRKDSEEECIRVTQIVRFAKHEL
jgi:hypothetical protein